MIQVGIPLVLLFLIVSLLWIFLQVSFGEDVSSRSCRFGLFLSHKLGHSSRQNTHTECRRRNSKQGVDQNLLQRTPGNVVLHRLL